MLKSTMDLLPNPAAGESVFDFAGAAFTPTADGAGIAAALDLSFSAGDIGALAPLGLYNTL